MLHLRSLLALIGVTLLFTAPASATAPVVQMMTPAASSTLSALAQITIVFDQPVVGVDAGDLVVAGNAAESVVQVDGPGTTRQLRAEDRTLGLQWGRGLSTAERLVL